MTRLDSLGRRIGWLPPAERFALRIAEVVPPAGFDLPCWQWDVVHPGHGYGTFHDGQPILAHRWSYEYHVGPIPDGLHLDHLCRNRGCVNPAHLEPVTARVNNLRGISPWAAKALATQCINGHPFDAANTIGRPNGTRGCRACQRAQRAAFVERAPERDYSDAPTHCKAGHEFTPENTHISPTSGRVCRACRAAYARQYRARFSAAAS